MSTRNPSLPVLALLLSLLTGSRAAPPPPPSADGLPNIQGTWAGSAHIKDFSLNASVPDAKGKLDYTFTLTQTGADLSGHIDAVINGSPTSTDVSGKIGDGKFWLQGLAAGQVSVIVGRVTGKAPHRKLKCAGDEGDANQVVTAKLVVVEQP